MSRVFLIALSIAATLLRQAKPCEHPTYRESLACHGICTKCEKDLGFVGKLDRTKHKHVGYTPMVNALIRQGKA